MRFYHSPADQDKPWVFAHLLQLQRRLGRDAFPLVEQTFFPNARELVSVCMCSFRFGLLSFRVVSLINMFFKSSTINNTIW